MQDKILEIEYRKTIYNSDRKRLIRLQEEQERILCALSETPSNSELINKLNAIEVTIAAITGDSAIDY